MKPGLTHRMDTWARLSLPVVSLMLLAFIVAIPVGLPGFPNIRPELVLIGTFYWAVFRDDLVPLTALFLIGLFQDSLTGAPLGLTSLMLLVAYGFAQSQKKAFFGRPFFIVWIGFGLLLAPLSLIGWVVASSFQQAVQPLSLVLGQVALTFTLFPIVVLPMIAAQRALLKEV